MNGMSKQINGADKELIVTKITQLEELSSQKVTYIKQAVDMAKTKADYQALSEQAGNIASDNYVSANEKAQLRRLYAQIQAIYASSCSQIESLGVSSSGSTENDTQYTDYIEDYSELSANLEDILSTDTAQEINGAALTELFRVYYNQQAVMDDIVFTLMNDAVERLTLTLSCVAFHYSDDGTTPVMLEDTAGNRTAQTSVAKAVAVGIGQPIHLYVNNTEVEHTNGSFTITTDYMSGRNFIYVRATCGDKEKDGIIQMVKDGGPSITVQILSLNGDKFRAGTCDTTLVASVWKGEEDITDTLDESAFTWERTSSDASSDEQWNTSSKATGHKSVTLTPEDVDGRAVFACYVDIGD
jgi:hypothetical protein